MHIKKYFKTEALAAAFITTAFAVSLFFEGAQSWLYAPALLCLLAGLLIAALSPGSVQRPAAWPALWLLAFSAYITLSLSRTQTPFPSLVTWLVYCSMPLTVFALLLSPRRDAFIKWASAGLHAALAALGLCGIISVLFMHHDRAAWPLDDPNNFAALMNLGLLPALATAFTARGRTFYMSAVAALVEFSALTATESRGGFLCFAVAALLMTAILHKQAQPFMRRNLKLAALLGIAFAAISLHAPGGGTAARLSSVATDESAMNRPVLWRTTLDMIAEHPLTGTGFGSFYLAYPAHRPLADRVSAGQWAHNDPLQFAAETGILALLLFYAFAASVGIQTRNVLKNAAPGQRIKIAGSLCALLAVFLHAHIEFQFYLMPVLIVSGVWLADWYAETAPGPSWKILPLTGAQKFMYAATVLVIAALFAVPALRCAAASHYLNRAVAAMKQGKPQTFMAYLDKADAVAPAIFIDARLQRAGLYIDLLATPGGLFSGPAQASMTQYVQTALEVAGKTMPLWSEVNDKRGAYYTAMKTRLGPDWQGIAESEYRAALRKNPLDTKARARLIDLLISRGDADDALALLDDGLARPHETSQQADMLALREKLTHLVGMKKSYLEHKP